MKNLTLALAALMLTSCVGGGYDSQRYHDDLSSWESFKAVSERWLAGVEPTELDKQEIPNTIVAWKDRLDADARVLGLEPKR